MDSGDEGEDSDDSALSLGFLDNIWNFGALPDNVIGPPGAGAAADGGGPAAAGGGAAPVAGAGPVAEHGAQMLAACFPLHVAAHTGDVAGARGLLDQNSVDIDLEAIGCTRGAGTTALFVAASKDDSVLGHELMVRLLVERGANVNHTSANGITPLHVAAEAGNLRTARVLIGAGANPIARGHDGRAPLHYAALHGNFFVAQLLLQQQNGRVSVNRAANGGFTPLFFAAERGHVALARLLLDCGARINYQTNTGNFPLCIAAHRGNVEMVQLLLDRDANINQTRPNGATALHVAAHERHLGAATRLLAHAAVVAGAAAANGSTALHDAAVVGFVELAPLLLDQDGVDIDQTKENGATALLLAVEYGHGEFARLLIERGADVDRAMNNGQFPLNVAVYKGNVEMTRMLLENGANVNRARANGATMLHVAAHEGNLGAARLLLEHGADANAAANNGATPLHDAADRGHVDIARLLLDHRDLRIGGAFSFNRMGSSRRVVDVNQPKGNGATPLLIAAVKNHVGLARLLLERGARAGQTMDNGQFPLCAVAHRGTVEMGQVLLAGGADVNQARSNGATVLHVAAHEGNLGVARLLLEHGAHVNAAANNGSIPLHDAAIEGHADVARLLAEHNANVALATNVGAETAVHIACRKQDTAVLAALVAASPTTAAAVWSVLRRPDQMEGEVPLEMLCSKRNPDHLLILLAQLPAAMRGTAEQVSLADEFALLPRCVFRTRPRAWCERRGEVARELIRCGLATDAQIARLAVPRQHAVRALRAAHALRMEAAKADTSAGNDAAGGAGLREKGQIVWLSAAEGNARVAVSRRGLRRRGGMLGRFLYHTGTHGPFAAAQLPCLRGVRSATALRAIGWWLETGRLRAALAPSALLEVLDAACIACLDGLVPAAAAALTEVLAPPWPEGWPRETQATSTENWMFGESPTWWRDVPPPGLNQSLLSAALETARTHRLPALEEWCTAVAAAWDGSAAVRGRVRLRAEGRAAVDRAAMPPVAAPSPALMRRASSDGEVIAPAAAELSVPDLGRRLLLLGMGANLGGFVANPPRIPSSPPDSSGGRVVSAPF